MLGECFDPKGEMQISEHRRPHWSQAGAMVFVTFRTHDSIPREVIERWDREKRDWLRQHGHENGADWSVIVPTLSEKDRADFQKTFDRCRYVDFKEAEDGTFLAQVVVTSKRKIKALGIAPDKFK